jgi:adenine phosphoribosyltransferase
MAQPSGRTNCDHLKKLIREVPDFPVKGILFYDITTLLKDRVGYATLIDALAEYYLPKKPHLVLGIEARGFIFGPALAYRLNAGFVPLRKPGKLPPPVMHADYQLEYGTDRLEARTDSLRPGERVLLVDDVLATGGTLGAARNLVEQLGAELLGASVMIELLALQGRALWPAQLPLHSVLHY